MRILTTPQWTAASIITTGLSALTWAHRKFADAPIAHAARVFERYWLGNNAPPLIEHFLSGIIWTVCGYLVVQFALMLREALEQNTANGRTAIGIRVLLAITCGPVVFEAFNRYAFSWLHYVIAAIVIAAIVCFLIRPLVVIRRIASRPLYVTFAVTVTIWMTFNLSWEIGQLSRGETEPHQAIEQLASSGMGVFICFTMMFMRFRNERASVAQRSM